MNFLWRWIKRGMLALIVLVLLLLAPVGYTHFACRGDAVETANTPVIDAEHHRAPAATYLTYPEWHIVFAYDDYARVIAEQDPHSFGYIKAISGFWGALCNLTEVSDAAGGAPETQRMVYVIGVSFTAELLAKAAYEETIGRLVALFRGTDRAAADDTSAQQARDYADFLHQVPWYKYDFDADAGELSETGDGFRNRERRFALGLEYGVKQAYAGVIAKAVEAVGPADLTIRSVVTGIPVEELRDLGDVTIIAAMPDGVQIETPRYAAFTELLEKIAASDGQIVEIAGNTRIMVTITGDEAPPALTYGTVLAELQRQGYNDTRWLLDLPLNRLADLINILEATDSARLEHIFDY
ncbi:MAG: hypothetical protein AAF393_08120 [Pseudomonadota bacterium]